MRNKVKPAKQPGWLHYRVLCDYIRDGIAKGSATYRELGLQDELELLTLELSCVEADITNDHSSPALPGLKRAIEGKIRTFRGKDVSRAGEDAILLFFPQTEREAA